MTQQLGKFGLITFVVGIIALLAWGEYDRGWMLTTALLSGGAGLVAGALEIVLTQRGQALEGVGRWYEQWGFALYPWAFVFLLLGGTLLVSGIVRFLGWDAAFASYISRRPGAALFTGGLVMVASGIATVIGPYDSRDSRWDLILRLPARIFGALMATTGLAAVLLGLYEVINHQGFDQWIEMILGSLIPFP